MLGSLTTAAGAALTAVQLPGCTFSALRAQSTGSTNADLKELLRDGRLTRPCLLYTHAQTSGRGTGSNGWLMQPGRDLALSVAFPPPAGMRHPDTRLPLAAGVAAALALGGLTGLAIRVKWPNDLLADTPPRKLAGILCESTSGPAGRPWLIAGIGVNVNSAAVDRPAELQGCAVSLAELCGRELGLDAVAAALAVALERIASGLDSLDALLERWDALGWLPKTAQRRGADGALEPLHDLSVDKLTGELLARTPDGRLVSVSSAADERQGLWLSRPGPL